MIVSIAKKLAAVSLVMGLALSAAAPSRGDTTVTYSTTGTFGATHTNVLTASNGTTLTYTPVPTTSVSVPPASFAPFGTFTLSGGSGTFGGFTGNNEFTLVIHQTQPGTGTTGTDADVLGTVKFLNSQAYIQFEQTNLHSIGTNPTVTYMITNADNGTPGRLNLPAPSSGRSADINGQININAVPEPTTLAAALVALPVLGLAGWMRSRKVQA